MCSSTFLFVLFSWVFTCRCTIVSMVWEAVWHSGYHRQLSSHRSPVRTRPTAVLPPTGLARSGTGAPPAFATILLLCPHQFSSTRQHQKSCAHGHIGKMCLATCSSAPHHPPRTMGGCHPTCSFARAAAPLERRLGQWGSNLGPVTLMCPATCSSAPHHRPRTMGGCHPTRSFARAAAPLERRLGQWGSNLGPATLESKVLPLKHMALHPY